MKLTRRRLVVMLTVVMLTVLSPAVALTPSTPMMRAAPITVGRTGTAITSLAPWQSAELAKVKLLAACEAAAMGREADRRSTVLDAIEAVERLNPTARPLEAPELLSGCWRLVYTTSDSILGTARPRPMKPQPDRILQSIDAASLSAKNEEWVLSGLLKNQVKAKCANLSFLPSRVRARSLACLHSYGFCVSLSFILFSSLSLSLLSFCSFLSVRTQTLPTRDP